MQRNIALLMIAIVVTTGVAAYGVGTMVKTDYS